MGREAQRVREGSIRKEIIEETTENKDV
jgi:hypothetical protein